MDPWKGPLRYLVTIWRRNDESVWDEPSLGRSTRPTTRDYSLEKFAADLEAVLALTGNKPAILGGHGIGGMITLTFCGLFPATLRRRVMGLVLTHTTPINPVRTTSGAAFYTAIEKPVRIPADVPHDSPLSSRVAHELA